MSLKFSDKQWVEILYFCLDQNCILLKDSEEDKLVDKDDDKAKVWRLISNIVLSQSCLRGFDFPPTKGFLSKEYIKPDTCPKTDIAPDKIDTAKNGPFPPHFSFINDIRECIGNDQTNLSQRTFIYCFLVSFSRLLPQNFLLH